MLSIKNNALAWLWLAIIVLMVDQLAKFLAFKYLALNQLTYVCPYFNLVLAYNTGAAFSFYSSSGHTANMAFLVFASVIAFVLICVLARTSSDKKLTACSMALILGGALGNIADRVRLGYVVDFLDVHFGIYHWPAFNIADSAICVGVVLVLLDMLFSKEAKLAA